MPEIDPQTVVILFSITVGLNVILLVMVIGIRRRLSRIERWLAGGVERPAETAPTAVTADVSGGGAFEMFLREDPSRKDLPKGEQFAEYRKWRQKKGLNWSNS